MRHLLELFIFFLILMALPDWYIYRTYIRHWKNKWLRYAYGLPSLVLIVSMVILFTSFSAHPGSMGRLGIFLVCFLCVNVPKAIFTLTSLLFRYISKRINHSFYETYIASAIALYTLGILVFGATEGKQHFQVIEETIECKDLPQEFDGYRIVQISDLHVGSWNGNTKPLEKAVNQINNLQPDLIVFTGDLVNNLATELDAYLPVLSQLKAKHGVYSVLGNHDYATYIHWNNEQDRVENLQSLQAKQAQMGWKLLNNSHVKLKFGTDSIALIGVENSGNPPFPNHARLKEASAGTEGMFKVLLSHDPSHWRREVLKNTDIQLMLSGHTHNMQTRIFGFTPSAFIYPEHSGLYREGNQMLYVNIGLGFLLYPMRLGAWPEITLLTFKK